MGFRDVVDLNLDDDRNDRNSVVMTDGNLCHRTNDLQDDLNLDGMMDGNHRGVLIGRYNCALDDRNLGVNLDVSLYLRRNDLLDDHRDLNLDGMTDGNLCHRMSDLLVDRKLDDVRHGLTMGDDLMTDVSRVNRNCVLLDQKMVLMKDGNRGHHMSDRLDDRSLDVMMDGNLYLRMNDLLVDHHGQKMILKMDAMSHHVK